MPNESPENPVTTQFMSDYTTNKNIPKKAYLFPPKGKARGSTPFRRTVSDVRNGQAK